MSLETRKTSVWVSRLVGVAKFLSNIITQHECLSHHHCVWSSLSQSSSKTSPVLSLGVDRISFLLYEFPHLYIPTKSIWSTLPLTFCIKWIHSKVAPKEWTYKYLKSWENDSQISFGRSTSASHQHHRHRRSSFFCYLIAGWVVNRKEQQWTIEYIRIYFNTAFIYFETPVGSYRRASFVNAS